MTKIQNCNTIKTTKEERQLQKNIITQYISREVESHLSLNNNRRSVQWSKQINIISFDRVYHYKRKSVKGGTIHWEAEIHSWDKKREYRKGGYIVKLRFNRWESYLMTRKSDSSFFVWQKVWTQNKQVAKADCECPFYIGDIEHLKKRPFILKKLPFVKVLFLQ